ncbi:MAG: hypothetical protein AAF989_13100 [Planctomycetota bacterium]
MDGFETSGRRGHQRDAVIGHTLSDHIQTFRKLQRLRASEIESFILAASSTTLTFGNTLGMPSQIVSLGQMIRWNKKQLISKKTPGNSTSVAAAMEEHSPVLASNQKPVVAHDSSPTRNRKRHFLKRNTTNLTSASTPSGLAHVNKRIP